MAKYTQLKTIIEASATDVEKFYQHGNKAAGTRLRNSLQQIKKLAQEIRVEVGE
ncbi:MAG: histone H1 [Mucilaginibacter sp.]